MGWDEACECHIQLVPAGEDSGDNLSIARTNPSLHCAFYTSPCRVSKSLSRSSNPRRNCQPHSPRLSWLSILIAFISAIHEPRNFGRLISHLAQQLAAFGRVVRISRRQREPRRMAIPGSKHMHFCIPSSAGLSDGLRAVFFACARSIGASLYAGAINRKRLGRVFPLLLVPLFKRLGKDAVFFARWLIR